MARVLLVERDPVLAAAVEAVAVRDARVSNRAEAAMNPPTLRSLALVPVLVATAAGALPAADSNAYLGVYAMPWDCTSVDGELVAFAPLDKLVFEASLGNEEGSEVFFLQGDLAAVLAIELRRDDRPVEVVAEWIDKGEQFSLTDEPPPEDPRRLAPGVGRKAELRLRRPGGELFDAGAYTLLLRVLPPAVRDGQGAPWAGRAGVGGARFTIVDPVRLEDLKLRLVIDIGRKFRAGDLPAALALCRQLIELDPSDPKSKGSLGAVQFQMRDYQAAATNLAIALRAVIEATGGERTLLTSYLAYAYVALGRTTEAAEVLEVSHMPDEIPAELARLQAVYQAEREAAGRGEAPKPTP